MFGRMLSEYSLKYENVKIIFLSRIRFIAGGYRERFRKSKAEDGETGVQFATRLEGYFDRWIEMSETEDVQRSK